MERRKFIKNIAAGAATTYLATNPFMGFAKERDDLSYHTIEKIFIKKPKMVYPRFVGKNAKKANHGWGYHEKVCELVTNQGARGWGVPRWARSIDDLKKHIIGKKVSDLFSPKEGLIDAKAEYCDISLYDLAGNILKKPAYEIMGAKKPGTTMCYSGMIYFDDLTQVYNKALGVDVIIKECQFDYDLGYRQFKLKIGRGKKWMPKKEGIQRDIEVTKLVAKAFPDCDVLVDANDGYTFDEFKTFLKGIEGTKLFWIEEPFLESMEDHTKLRALLNDMGSQTYIADGEYKPNLDLLKKLIENKLVDVHLSDIQTSSIGYSGWRKLLTELKKLEAYGSPHAWGSQIKTNAISHLAAVHDNVLTIEGVTCISDDVDFGKYHLKDGKLIPSDEPGFGMKLLVKDE